MNRADLRKLHDDLARAEYEARQALREERKGSDDKVTPKGAGQPLPPLSKDVTITDADIDAAFALWNKLMKPEERGQLDAEVAS